MANNSIRTKKKVASKAASILNDKRSSTRMKSVAGSAMVNAKPRTK